MTADAARYREAVALVARWLASKARIGSTLLRAVRHLDGDRKTLALPHVPDWGGRP